MFLNEIRRAVLCPPLRGHRDVPDTFCVCSSPNTVSMVFETAFAVVVAIVRLLWSVSSDDTVQLWDVYSGKLKKIFNGHISMGSMSC